MFFSLKVFSYPLESYRFSAPKGSREKYFQSMIFDSWFDRFRGAIACVKVEQGILKKGQKIRSFRNCKDYEVAEVGVMHPNMVPLDVSLHLFIFQKYYNLTRLFYCLIMEIIDSVCWSGGLRYSKYEDHFRSSSRRNFI